MLLCCPIIKNLTGYMCIESPRKNLFWWLLDLAIVLLDTRMKNLKKLRINRVREENSKWVKTQIKKKKDVVQLKLGA